MDEYIKKVFDLIYSPIVTPYNLLKNAKLKNYSYVKYYKGVEGLIVEMKCITLDNYEAIFYYHFDSEDSLLRIYMKKQNDHILVFDRSNELENLQNDHNNSKNDIAI